ncbi:MAG: NHLP bacteriocin system secretion protein [Nostoc sp. EfeVER01]|uniref:NHLP bacteriocin system secretion protein n=1 Tax=unclassified Nostoc TaxID=2593658 RepID=UPI002AD2EEA5|nr:MULTISPECIES: NHLP bacteriocin system secretion protein [unclassified Nostoc]MDZ7944061.1 NHLP bacteriocin system secretion protein [Nostoc sp. EfeVER01]MDZ7993931.1 NHLP bacteriocin system secretion protein [Nostoc sp. EspVER01]
MINQKSNLFRKEALERISSPEELDQIMQVVSPKKWLPLVAVGSLVASGLTWSFLGRIPITVMGTGIIVYPSTITSFQSPIAGRLRTVNVRVGDFVNRGDVLATLDQSELMKQLQLVRLKLEQLQQENRDANSVQRLRQNADKQALIQQRQSLQQSLQTVQKFTPILREKGLNSIQRDRTSQIQSLQSLRELLPTFKQRLDNRKQLLKEGAISGDTVLQSQQDYLNAVRQINEAESQLKQLDVKEADAQRQYLENLNSIKDLESQLKQLDSKEATLAQQDLEAVTIRKKEIQEVQRNITQLALQLSSNSLIKSTYSGRVLEISATPGQVVLQGTPIGAIAAQKRSVQLESVAFFPVGDGKQIQPGMKLQVTPSTVQRERFGGIIGAVTDVSAFPVTKEGALSVVGSSEFVQGLMSQGPQILITARLQPDTSTVSRYKWSSSKGPEMKVTSGTTTSVQVTVEERAPITFVLPILRSWSGVY